MNEKVNDNGALHVLEGKRLILCQGPLESQPSNDGTASYKEIFEDVSMKWPDALRAALAGAALKVRMSIYKEQGKDSIPVNDSSCVKKPTPQSTSRAARRCS